MTLRSVLEDFARTRPGARDADPVAADGVDVEQLRLESFDQGYRAGWDDALKAQNEDGKRIAGDLAQNLQDLSFTYHEAYSHVLKAMTPLLNEIATVLLPGLEQEALRLHLVAQLQDIAREGDGLAVDLAVAPVHAEALAPLVDEPFGFPLRLIEDDSLADGQADIRFAGDERRIDLGEVLQGVKDAVQGFAYDTRRKTAHG
ncbi:ABC transporter ATP-binding protein [Thalassococcus sp. CAU 1522]|uniref:ABC transporter ATP-binding protein n=1 Tax=Thalassococcus arenae TaxID=2851652 RepID=A0ABS6N662_9RHOB|nr:ABC transporter ATP-binding protein [Thalassococcus arenae]MBV2359278.1 ABC transporter ATP-binding protein [Thalassococcus arenae]